MILCTVSLGLTALREMICSGIPGLIGREIPVVDYMALDVDHLQVGDTDFAIDPARNPVLAEKYLRWNEAETYFPRAAV